MSDFTVPAPADADVPQTHKREKAPNPFLEFFPKSDGKAHSWVFPNKTEADQKAVKRIVSLIRAAGVAHGVTNRVTVTELEGKQAGRVEVRAWSVAKITRPRKAAE